uniref:RRM domain-containing protein n=1 Tax=Setaria digitata TaxID=48799 RepID=A0A915PY33_9BILA
MARRNECLECKVFVGGLPNDASSEELEEAFSKYGRIKKVWLARRPPGFAFVEFEDSRDAEDAVKGLDGTRICGVRPRVEFSHGGSRRGGRGGGGRRRSRNSVEWKRNFRDYFPIIRANSTVYLKSDARTPSCQTDKLMKHLHGDILSLFRDFDVAASVCCHSITIRMCRTTWQKDFKSGILSYYYPKTPAFVLIVLAMSRWEAETPMRRRSLSRSRSPPPRRSPRYSRSRSRSLNRLAFSVCSSLLL